MQHAMKKQWKKWTCCIRHTCTELKHNRLPSHLFYWNILHMWLKLAAQFKSKVFQDVWYILNIITFINAFQCTILAYKILYTAPDRVEHLLCCVSKAFREKRNPLHYCAFSYCSELYIIAWGCASMLGLIVICWRPVYKVAGMHSKWQSDVSLLCQWK